MSYRMISMDSVVDYLSDDESDSEVLNGSVRFSRKKMSSERTNRILYV